MRLKIGDKVYWVDFENPETKTRGEVTEFYHDRSAVVTWENGRMTEYSDDMIIKKGDTIFKSKWGEVKLDIQDIRMGKLKDLGI